MAKGKGKGPPNAPEFFRMVRKRLDASDAEDLYARFLAVGKDLSLLAHAAEVEEQDMAAAVENAWEEMDENARARLLKDFDEATAPFTEVNRPGQRGMGLWEPENRKAPGPEAVTTENEDKENPEESDPE